MQEVLAETLAREDQAAVACAMPRGELDRQAGRGDEAAGIGAAGAGEVERRAVVHRGAHDGQPQRHVHRVAEAGVLEHRQALVVVHGQHHVVVRQRARHEHGVGRQRAVDQHAGGARALDGGRDHVAVLGAEMAALAGVRIEAAHGDARPRDAPEPAHVVVEDAQRGVEQRRGDRIADRAQRQVRGGERHAQRVRRPAASPGAPRRCAPRGIRCGPVNGTPASLMTLFCTGAVTMAANSPLTQPSMARSSSASTWRALAGSSRPATQGAASGTSSTCRRPRRRAAALPGR